MKIIIGSFLARSCGCCFAASRDNTVWTLEHQAIPANSTWD